MGKVMRVYLCGQDGTDSRGELYLNLPATPWELVDALEKLRLDSEDYAYVQAEEYYDFDYIQDFIPEDTSLSRLNELCAVLDGMDEQDRLNFRGLLQSSAFFDRFNMSFDRLMDIALAKDCCHIAADVENDEQLGRFLCLNGFIAGTEELPDEVYELLNFEKIGKQFRIGERGAFADGCYVAADGEIPHQELYCGIYPPEYIVMIDILNRDNTSKHFPLALPADYSQMDVALKQVGAESWSEAWCICTDCQVPQLIDAITRMDNIAIANRFAEMLDRLSADNVSKLKAVLEAMQCEELTNASLIVQELDSYTLSEDIQGPEDIGRRHLSYLLSAEDMAAIQKHLNLYAYGRELLEQSGAAMSTYGLVERNDGQPILAPTTQTAPQMSMQ